VIAEVGGACGWTGRATRVLGHATRGSAAAMQAGLDAQGDP